MRSFLFWFGSFVQLCSTAFANCGSDQSTCTASCVVGAAMTKQFGGGNQCTMDCLSAGNACEALETQQRQMEEQRQQAQEQQRQQAAERQAQQARDAKEIAGNRQNFQKAGEIAQRVGAEAAIQQQFDASMEKGMQALDQKGYISAEFQFKAALKIKPNDLEAKAGQLRAILGAGKRATALTYASDQLTISAAQPPGGNGRSTYSRWLAILADNGLVGETERAQLERIYPFGGGDPASAAAAFPKTNPKSSFLPFARQIASVIPAIRAEYEDRRKEIAKRDRDEDEAWQQAQKTATHASMQAYINRYPNGRYITQARQKDAPPPRPNLPFIVDESIWRALEASEMYRNAPIARAFRVHRVSKQELQYKDIGTQPPTVYTADVDTERLSDRCKLLKSRLAWDKNIVETQTYNCGGITLGKMRDGKLFSSLKKLGPLSGSLYPPQIGAEQRVQYEVREVEGQKLDGRETQRCTITGRLEARQVNSRLTGAAWAVRCEREFRYSEDVAKPTAYEAQDYLIEDLGLMMSDIAMLDSTSQRYTFPTIGFAYAHAHESFNQTITYLNYEWAVGEEGAQSVPPLSK